MTVHAYAKLNLSLDILGRRPDGYHDLAMVMQSVSLYDVIEVERSNRISLVCSHGDVPCDERNTAWRAAAVFFQAAGIPDGADIYIKKRIPSQAGMGGGSADAAAVLLSLDNLYCTGFSQEQLCALGLSVGADVPFCLRGGTLLAGGVGERLSALPPLPGCTVLICKPPVNVSTAEAFRRADESTRKPAGYTTGVEEALIRGSLQATAGAMGNDFQQVIAIPEVEQICGLMRAGGALGAAMTGSGSAVFGLFSDEKTANACALLLKPLGELFLCNPVSQGCKFIL